MRKWFGNLWLLRLLLLIAAGAISFGLLPWGARRLQPVEPIVFLGYLGGQAGPPVLLRDRYGQASAWDWRTGESWLIPDGILPNANFFYYRDVRTYPAVVSEGELAAIATLNENGHEIELIDLRPPFKQTIISLPVPLQDSRQPLVGRTLLAMDRSRRFALVYSHYEGAPSRIESIDVETGREVDAIARTSDDENSPSRLQGAVVGNGDGIRICESDSEGKRCDICYDVTNEGKFVEGTISESFSHREDDWFRRPNFSHARKTKMIDGRTLQLECDDVQKVPIRISASVGITSFDSSRNGKELFTIDRQSTVDVWEIATGKRIAEWSLDKRKARFSALVITIGTLLWALCMTMAVRESRLWWAMFDCFLSTGVAMAWVCEASGLAGLMQPTAGLAMAAGIYIAVSSESLWRRVMVVVVAGFTLLVAFDGPARWSTARRLIASDTSGLGTASPVFGLVLPTLIAALGVWMFQRFGWRPSQKGVESKGRPFQFSLGGLLFVTLLVALTVQLREYQYKPDLSWTAISARLGGLTAVSLGLPVALSWLWLRDWPAWQWRFTVGVAIILAAASFVFLATDELFRNQFFVATADSLVPWAVGLISLSLPLFVARRHGYRWIRTDSATTAG